MEDGWPTSCLFVLRNGSCNTIDNRRKQSSKQGLMGSDEERREAKRGREGEAGWVGGDWFTRRGRKCKYTHEPVARFRAERNVRSVRENKNKFK